MFVLYSYSTKIIIFASMNINQTETVRWCENVIIADTEYIDKVAFDLTVNFERMLGRRIPQADLAKWIDCIALDGGMREGEHETQVIFVRRKGCERLQNFTPSHFDDEINGKAFKDRLGEFSLGSHHAEDMADKNDFFLDVVRAICSEKEIRRIMIIPDAESIYDGVRQALKDVDEEKRITLFAMQPMPGGNFRQEILGYSLMAALGIRGEELDERGR